MFSRWSWMAFTTAGSRAHSVVGRCSLASAARVVPQAPAPMTVSFIVASPPESTARWCCCMAGWVDARASSSLLHDHVSTRCIIPPGRPARVEPNVPSCPASGVSRVDPLSVSGHLCRRRHDGYAPPHGGPGDGAGASWPVARGAGDRLRSRSRSDAAPHRRVGSRARRRTLRRPRRPRRGRQPAWPSSSPSASMMTPITPSGTSRRVTASWGC